MDGCGSRESSTPLRIFSLEQMAFAGARTQYFASGGNLKAFRNGLLCFNPFWASHKFNPIS